MCMAAGRSPGLRTCATLRSPTSGFTTWTRVWEVSWHRTITSPMCRKDSATESGWMQCPCRGSFLDSQLEHAETCSTAEATREHHARVHAVVCGMKLADPGINTEPRGSQLRNPAQLALSLPLLSHRSGSPRRCCTGGIRS